MVRYCSFTVQVSSRLILYYYTNCTPCISLKSNTFLSMVRAKWRLLMLQLFTNNTLGHISLHQKDLRTSPDPTSPLSHSSTALVMAAPALSPSLSDFPPTMLSRERAFNYFPLRYGFCGELVKASPSTSCRWRDRREAKHHQGGRTTWKVLVSDWLNPLRRRIVLCEVDPFALRSEKRV